jgi:hypothetical protein
MPQDPVRNRRPFPLLGILLVVAIVLAVIAFGLFKRKGARKPPPLPAESSVGFVAGRPARAA